MTDRTKSRIQRAFPATHREMLESENPAVQAFRKKYGDSSHLTPEYKADQKDKNARASAMLDALTYGTGIYIQNTDGSAEYVSHDELFAIGEKRRVCTSPLAARPVLYTDTVGGNQSMRDDLWAVTTDELNQTAKDALDAARYCKLRQMFKNNEISLELWGMTFKDQDTVCGEDDLEDFVDAAIEAEKAANAR